MKIIIYFLILCVISSSSVAMCTEKERWEMKKNNFTDSQISKICLDSILDEKNIYHSSEYDLHTVLRIGRKSAEGKFSITTPYGDAQGDEIESGVEFSYLLEKNYYNKIGWRFGYTLIYTKGEVPDTARTAGKIATSTSLYLIEFEFFHKSSKHFSPFIGFNGGTGEERFKMSVFNYNENVNAAQVSTFFGVSGDINKKVGYYIKITSFSRKHETTNYDERITHSATDTTFGLSYKI